MTAAAEQLAPVTPSARRFRLADPSMILWLVMIAILVFLIASPMVRLVVSSFQEPETGRLTLSNYAEAYGHARHLQALFPLRVVADQFPDQAIVTGHGGCYPLVIVSCRLKSARATEAHAAISTRLRSFGRGASPTLISRSAPAWSAE